MLALAPAAPAAGGTASGLYGVVWQGPTQPVCRIDVPCSAPAQTTLVFTRFGRQFRVRTRTDGRYRAVLPPGIYAVTTAPRIGFGFLQPARVKVRPARFDHLDFRADTGIR